MSVEELRAVDHRFLRAHELAAAAIVAERVGARLERGEGGGVGLRLRRVHAARREGHLDQDARGLRRFLERRAAAQHDQVGERNLLADFFWIISSVFSTLASCAGWFTSQSFCGARRMRAPFAPPRLSEPRKVEAEAQAVETSCGTVRPEARIFAFSAAMSFSPIGLWSSLGIGSCQMSGSFGTSGPR